MLKLFKNHCIFYLPLNREIQLARYGYYIIDTHELDTVRRLLSDKGFEVWFKSPDLQDEIWLHRDFLKGLSEYTIESLLVNIPFQLDESRNLLQEALISIL